MSRAMMASFRSLLRVVGILALMIGVTGGGMMAGALFTSPMATNNPWVRPAIIASALVIAAIMLVLWLKPASKSAARPASAATAMPSPSMPSLSMPSFTLPTLSMPSLSMGGKTDRTPRAVQALAAAGTAPTEISWKTGLPLDAVALLLAMSTASRQLQPPTA